MNDTSFQQKGILRIVALNIFWATSVFQRSWGHRIMSSRPFIKFMNTFAQNLDITLIKSDMKANVNYCKKNLSVAQV